MAMVDGAAAGGIMRSTSIIVDRTISRRTTTIVPSSTKTRVRIGSITRNTGEVPNIPIRTRLRSMGSSVPGPGAEQPHRMRGALAVAQVQGVAAGLKPAISVVAEAVKMPWAVLEKEEASVLPAIGARKAAPLLLAARDVSEGVDQAAVVEVTVAAVEEPPVAAVEEPPEVAAVVGVDVGKHE